MVVVAVKAIVPNDPLPPASDTIGPRIRNRSASVTDTCAAWNDGPVPGERVTRLRLATGAALSLLSPSRTNWVTRAWTSVLV